MCIKYSYLSENRGVIWVLENWYVLCLTLVVTLSAVKKVSGYIWWVTLLGLVNSLKAYNGLRISWQLMQQQNLND